MSGRREVLAHPGAALHNVNADDLLEFFLVAQIKGKIAEDDNHDTIPQLNFRASGQHAFSSDLEERDVARELLNLWHLEPDDEAMVDLLHDWRREFYLGCAPDISRKEGPEDNRRDGVAAWSFWRLV